MAEKEKKENAVAKLRINKKATKKKEESSIEDRPAFETRPDIKKLCLYMIIVPRGQADNITRILKLNKSSAQFIKYGEGTAINAIREILGVENNEKDIIYSVVREDAVPDIKKELDVYFLASKNNRGIAFTIRLTSVMGVKVYKFLTQTVRG